MVMLPRELGGRPYYAMRDHLFSVTLGPLLRSHLARRLSATAALDMLSLGEAPRDHPCSHMIGMSIPQRRSNDHQPPIPSRQGPRSRIESWTTDVRTQSEGSPSLGLRSGASFASGSNAATHSVSSSREREGRKQAIAVRS